MGYGGDECDIVLLEVVGGLPRKHNNRQLAVYYATNATGGNDNTTTATDTDDQGTREHQMGDLGGING